LVPLALGGPTALLLLPAHFGLSLVVAVGAAIDGADGYPDRARRWGFGYLVATTAMVAALEIGARVRGLSIGYWGVPWSAALLWGWAPPRVAGIAGAGGPARERRRRAAVVRARRVATRSA